MGPRGAAHLLRQLWVWGRSQFLGILTGVKFRNVPGHAVCTTVSTRKAYSAHMPTVQVSQGAGTTQAGVAHHCSSLSCLCSRWTPGGTVPHANRALLPAASSPHLQSTDALPAVLSMKISRFSSLTLSCYLTLHSQHSIWYQRLNQRCLTTEPHTRPYFIF